MGQTTQGICIEEKKGIAIGFEKNSGFLLADILSGFEANNYLWQVPR